MEELCQVWLVEDCCCLMNRVYVAGWYHHFPCTIGHDPKPICIGATFHSLAVIHGTLKFYIQAVGTY